MKLKNAIHSVWNYHQMHHDLEKADLIWALGSHDLRVADRAAKLWIDGLAPRIVMSGGLGNFTEGVFEKPEAELFADRAIELGVLPEAILLEQESTNTGENVSFTRKLLAEHEICVAKVIAVQKPYMERRTYATIRQQWSEVNVQVTSPQLSFLDYCNDSIPQDDVINIMVGDLQRIIEYPKLGFSIKQEVPKDVLTAWQLLIDAGFKTHLLV